MKVICDNCNKSFEFENDMLKVNYLGSLKTEVTYNCPFCNEKNVAGVMSTKARMLKREMEELRIVISNKLKDGYKICKEQERIIEISKELQNEMEKYNRRRD